METVTIINNSGKIISTGKQLVNIFKEAKISYQEKKAQLKAERARRDAERGRTHVFEIKRSHTFDVSGPHRRLSLEEGPGSGAGGAGRRASCDDTASRASSRRSHRTHQSGSRHHAGRRSHAATTIAEEDGHEDEDDGGGSQRLTAANLHALGAVPVGATGMLAGLSKGVPAAAAGSRGGRDDDACPDPAVVHRSVSDPALREGSAAAAPQFREPQFQQTGPASVSSSESSSDSRSRSPTGRRSSADAGRSSDDDLAYGSIPPNLASRTDLDPRPRPVARTQSLPQPATRFDTAASLPPSPSSLPPSQQAAAPSSATTSSAGPSTLPPDESAARALAERIEDLLDEAQCLHQSATTIISQLQGQPEAAAAVALTLAELSAILAKLSPTFLGTLKGVAPAVFALLASPQFLVAAGVAVGVTVVMFGGWKIIKRIKERNDDRVAFAADPVLPHGPGRILGEVESTVGDGNSVAGTPAALPPIPPPSAAVEEPEQAQEQEQELDPDLQRHLSKIDCWRRAIIPESHEDHEEAAIKYELLSPEAREFVLGKAKISPAPILVDSDAASESGRSRRSSRSHRSSTSSSGGSRSHRSSSHKGGHGHGPASRRHSSTPASSVEPDEPAAAAPDHLKRRASHEETAHDRELERLVSMSASTRAISEWDAESIAPTEHSSRTHRSSRSDRTHRSSRSSHRDSRSGVGMAAPRTSSEKLGGLRVIEEVRSEDGSEVGDGDGEKKKKKKKDGILKSMFKGKLKREMDRDREEGRVVMV